MPRIRLTQDPPLCSVEEAFTLLANAKAFIEQPEDRNAFRVESRQLRLLQYRAALDASLVAVEVATDTGDPHLLSAALEGAYDAARWDRLEAEETFAAAVEEILPRQPEITNRIRECARSRSPVIRAATAAGLGARALRSLQGQGDAVDAEAARIVVELMKDKDPEVRQRARESVAGMAPPAWLTFFPSDPLASRSASEAARLRAPLDAAAEALEKGIYLHTRAFMDAIAQLPDELAVPILEAWARTRGALSREGSDTLLERWLRGDDEGERLLRWLLDGKHEEALINVEKAGVALQRAPHAQRIASCLRIAHALVRSEANMREYQLSQVLTHAWPRDVDRTQLLEIALGTSLQEASNTPALQRNNAAIFQLVMIPGPGLETVKSALIEAYLAGAPGRWQSTAFQLEKAALTMRDARLRAHAERQLSEGGKGVTWALEYLTGVGHDPATDPPVAQILLTAIQDAATRAVITKVPALVEKVKQPLRAMILQPGLAPEEVVNLAAFAGAATEAPRKGSRYDFTEDEMRAICAARVLLENDSDVVVALNTLPEFSGWTESDYAFVEDTIRRFGSGRVAIILAGVFEKAASPKLLPLAEELLRVASPHALVWARRAVKACRAKQEEA